MKRSLRSSATLLPITLLSAIVFAACGDAPFVAPEAPADVAFDAVAANAAQPGPDDWIVVFKPGVADPPGLARRLVSEHGGTIRFTYQYAIQGFAATLPAQALNGIRNNPNVDYVEADGVVTIGATQANPPSWGLDRIDQQDGLDNSYTYSFDGAGVTAYILDTGIQITHSDFGTRASVGTDEIGDGRNGIDCHGHGTHVAGTVGGSAHGVAKNAKLVAVRVLNCAGSGSSSGVIAGIDWVTENHVYPAVANMSLGGGFWQSLNDAVSGSIAAGVVYAVSAGNENKDACTRSPASTPDALTTGSTTSSDARSSFSNYGTCVALFAPGSSITSAWIGSNTATRTISGTSMASPHVAGVAALRRQQCPGEDPTDVANAILGAATSGRISNPGSGSPNLLLYSRLVATDCSAGTGPPTPDPTVVSLKSVPLPDVGGKKRLNGNVTVEVALGPPEAQGGPASEVTVHGTWYGIGSAFVQNQTSQTGPSGQASFSIGGVRGATSLQFCVNDLSGNNIDADFSGGEVCGPFPDSGTGDPGYVPPSGLDARAKQKGKARVNLNWTPGTATIVDIFRSDQVNNPIAPGIPNSGSYTDWGSHVGLSYRVCDPSAATETCTKWDPAN